VNSAKLIGLIVVMAATGVSLPTHAAVLPASSSATIENSGSPTAGNLNAGAPYNARDAVTVGVVSFQIPDLGASASPFLTADLQLENLTQMEVTACSDSMSSR